ncbi:hypothetical protein [Limnoglobus roseus]|uniref:Uncharacterized protein n=1 Tax=Limnoglobus roseus TaxID=2598579 RepID=A0A5C1A6E9_9BACT|nr:hypothetical protein [Limnoglobus roseus]QEL13955.1 hypothetical protein PX52LOC_00815 [Limnoglobus roseus]
MWTPRRILMLVIGLFAFGTAYTGYAQIFGAIDGLPNLPAKYLDAVDTPAPPIIFHESPTILRLKEAFGQNCVEIESSYPTRLELRDEGIVFAAGRPDPIDNPSRFVRLAPFSMAQFGKPKDGEVTEVTTMHGDEAIIELDKPIGNEREMLIGKAKIIGFELRATPNPTARTDPRNGRILITNNQQSNDPNKAFVFKTPGPLFYRTQDHPDVINNPNAPHIWTSAVVEIVNRENQPRPIRGSGLPSVPLNADDVLNGNILADMALGHHTPPPTITAEGMKIYLKPRNPAEVKPGAKSAGFAGIRELVLNENVEFNLWGDGQSSFFGDSQPKPPAAKGKPDANGGDPTLGLTALGGGIIDGMAAAQRLKEKSLVRIRTLGAFYYDWGKNTARFEVSPQANPLLPNNVEVTRLSPLGGRDHLVCQLLEIEFNGPISRTPNAPPKDGTKPPSSQFKNLRATGHSVYLSAETEGLQAFGTALIHETEPEKRLTRSTLRGSPLVAVRQGNRLVTGAAATQTSPAVVGQLVMESIEPPPNTKQQKTSRVEVRGVGKVDLFDEVTKTNTMTASWKESLTQLKDKVGEKECDLLVFVGDGRFTDPKTGFDLKADTLKLWLEAGQSGSKGGEPSSMESAKPARVQGIGHVEGHSEDTIIKDTDRFNAFFQDVAKPIQQEQASTTTPAPAPAAAVPPPALPTASPFLEPVVTVTVVKPKPKPMELSARQIEVRIARSPMPVKPNTKEKPGVRYEIDTARCEGRVVAHQDAAEANKPDALHIVGETLNIDHLPAGHAMKVFGTDEKLAFVQFEDTTITGPDVDINQPNNTVTVKGRGQLRMPSSTDLAGTPLNEKSEMQIDWQRGMTFKGELRSAEFIGQVQAVQLPPERKPNTAAKVAISAAPWQRSYVICHRLSVQFDRPIYFNQMKRTENAPAARTADKDKKDEAKIERVLCEPQPEEDGGGNAARPANYVYFADETIDRKTGKHVKAQRITAKFLDVQVQDTRTVINATGPGETRTLQLGSKDAQPQPAGTPPPPPNQKKEEEMKLTVVRFAERLVIEDKKQIFQKAVFTSNIRVFHIPTLELDLDVPEHLTPPRSLVLKCTDTLTTTVYQNASGTEDRRTMEAVGDARVRTDDYDGVGHIVKYDGNLITLEAYGDGQATIYQRKGTGVGREKNYKSGNPLIYNLKTGQISGNESSGGTFSK